jgi:hypothetical protein
VEGEHLAKQLSAAERRLADAAARLRAALEAALAASTHESRHRTLLDQLVWEYCQAKRAVEGASLAWERWQRCQAAADAPTARESPAPPTPALRFARWLYERGYIAG